MIALEELLVDARELDREMVCAVLLPYLRIDRATGEILPLSAWEDAPNEVRILLYLLARRAMRALELPLPCARDAALPVEIERATGIPGGSVRPVLKRLLKARVIAKLEGIGYIVPNYAISRVRDYVRSWAPDLVA
jgi:hypothetical protein